MRWYGKKTALSAIVVASALAGVLLIAPSSAYAEEAPGCMIWADPPAQAGIGVVKAIGHRYGCVQNRKEITIRIRNYQNLNGDVTMATTTYTNKVNGDFTVYWYCETDGPSLVYFAEILTNAGGSDQSPHIHVQCPRSWLSGPGATPASAATTVEKFCVVWVNKTYRLTVSADYTDNNNTQIRTWTGFHYRLQGGDSDEDSNNVIIRVHEYGAEKWSYSSPDSLSYDHSYVLRPSTPVRTIMGAKVLITFGGIFDRSLATDPSCTALLYA